MELEDTLPPSPSGLSRDLRLVAAREHGVEAEQLRWIGTDAELFEVFYREHVEEVQQFVARRIADRERAADLTAEIFIAVIESAQCYRPRRGTPKAWLYGIARVVVAGDSRRRRRERVREERLRGSELLGADDAAGIDARIDAAAEARHLYTAMIRLPDAERSVLELVALDDLTVAEAAAAIGVRPVTARVRLHRARAKLRSELEAPSTETNASTGVGS